MDGPAWLDALGAIEDAPQPLPAPGAHDWLAIHEERGQTFDDFVRSAVRPRASERTIYIQPVDTEGSLSDTCLSTLAAFAGAFFQLAVRVQPPLVLERSSLRHRERRPTRARPRSMPATSWRGCMPESPPMRSACWESRRTTSFRIPS